MRNQDISDANSASTLPNKRKPVDPQVLTRQRAQSERITALARQLIAAIDQRFGIAYVDRISLDHQWITAHYCDGSYGDLLQYETRELLAYRRASDDNIIRIR
jgi:hypothetical protein